MAFASRIWFIVWIWRDYETDQIVVELEFLILSLTPHHASEMIIALQEVRSDSDKIDNV